MIRLKIFIDCRNTISNYSKYIRTKPRNKYGWDILNWEEYIQYILNEYRHYYSPAKVVGTMIVLAESPIGEQSAGDYDTKEALQNISKVFGLNVHFTLRKRENGKWVDKGVDAYIASHMLLGAFENHYDDCIIVSDDADFSPVVTMLQDFFGKKVVHAGYNRELALKSYFSIDLKKLKNDPRWKK